LLFAFNPPPMRSLLKTFVLASVPLLLGTVLFGAAPVIKPVTPDALPEVAALLSTLQDISGRYTLTGQHNPPAGGDRNSRFAANYTGKTPAVWTCDFGFAAAGDSDSTEARPAIVQEAIRQHKKGSIISLCWHAVPPTADEPVTFQPLPGSDPKALKSVQGQLLDEQFKDVLTPGTALYNHWVAQVDVIAGFLKQLEEARVPILWRPYHEMNGSWFWWGGRTEGKYTTAALYRQLYDRFVNHHHLKNLVWLWSMDRMSKPNMEHEKYFPGIEYVDVLGLDVYGGDFAQSYYDSLVKLSQGKPLALAEVGNPPSTEILEKQPLWTYYAIWSGMVRITTRKQYAVLMDNKRLLGLDDPAYAELVSNYRKTCGLPPVKAEALPANFSGTWVLNEDLSKFGPMGAGFSPARLVVTQQDKALTVQTAIIRESADDDVSEASYQLDGTVTKTEFMKSPRTTIAKLSDDKSSLTLESEIAFVFAPPGSKFKSKETWTIVKGDRLSIENVSDVFMGPGKMTQTFIFDRR
jgi:mannan endo-1,4-beta-mannosidase